MADPPRAAGPMLRHDEGLSRRRAAGDDSSVTDETLPFEQLDFLYIPSADVAADARYFADVLGGTVLFAIDDGGTHAAMVELAPHPPRLIFTDHLEGERAIMIFRVPKLRAALKTLAGLDPRKAQVVELRFFGGLSVPETAEVLKVSSVTVMRDWNTAKAWLYRELTRPERR